MHIQLSTAAGDPSTAAATHTLPRTTHCKAAASLAVEGCANLLPPNKEPEVQLAHAPPSATHPLLLTKPLLQITPLLTLTVEGCANLLPSHKEPEVQLLQPTLCCTQNHCCKSPHCVTLTVEGCADFLAPNEEPEVQLAHVSVVVAEGVCVLLDQQVLQHAALGHQPEQVEVAAEEHVQAHLQ